MKLKIKNIGELKDVELVIDGLTVIAGENNSGKSTLNKAFYSAFNALNKIDENIFYDRVDSFLDDLQEKVYSNINNSIGFRKKHELRLFLSSKDLKKQINTLFLKGDNSKKEIEEYFKKGIEQIGLSDILGDLDDIFNITAYENVSDDIIKEKIATKIFQSEFDYQINNIYIPKDAEVTLQIGKQQANYKIKENKVIDFKTDDLSLELQAVYIDDIYSIDNIKHPSGKKLFEKGHKTALHDSFFNFYDNNITTGILKEERLEKIYSLINGLAKGDIVYDPIDGVRYKEVSDEDGEINTTLSFSNISAGLKSFILLKELILNDTIKDNGTIIFDEPEIHLHPEWQIKLAELIVLLQREYGMHIVLTTHSPYFLYALEVFSTKHGIASKTNYYFSIRNKNNIEVRNVNKNLEIIYSALNKPFQHLEDLTNDLY